MVKKPIKDTIFNLKTAISAATLVAVFIVCFFVLLPPPETKPVINENVSSSKAEMSSEESSIFEETSSKEESSSRPEPSSKTETSSKVVSSKTETSTSSKPASSKPQTSSQMVSSKEEPKPIPLVVNSPKGNTITVTDKNFSLLGSCDPKLPLYINNKAVLVAETGDFSADIVLNVGTNIITIKQGNTVITKTITYRFVVIKDFFPHSASSYASGSNLVVSVTARKGSVVTAAFNSNTITLTPDTQNLEETEFVSYFGMFTLPKDNLNDIKLGKIKFTGGFNGVNESFYSGEITVNKTTAVSLYDPAVTPTDSGYMNVGSGYVAEVIAFQAETLDGRFTAKNVDWSRPTNNYLPQGTVDYCSTELVYDSSGEKSYVTLRCGKRVYFEYTDSTTKETTRVVKQYIAKLPDHNELAVAGFEIKDKHTYLTLNTNWKAPFKVSFAPQGYLEPNNQDYRIENATFSYLDITFCYATLFSGEIIIPEGHPVFKSAEIIQKKSECILRLHLKEKGEFYGWDATYNEKGQLVFSFLNPTSTKPAANEYGRDLSGTTILIDVGHGGKDVGAYGINPQKLNEAGANLKFALLLSEELKKTGANVVLTRTEDKYLSHDARQKQLKNLAPDLCVAIHHDANNSSRLNGFGSFYFNAFSKKAAEFVYNRNIATGLYNRCNKNRLDWHYFFLGRTTTCPVVLTENGYMTNSSDFALILSDEAMKTKVKAIALGVTDYFAKISP